MRGLRGRSLGLACAGIATVTSVVGTSCSSTRSTSTTAGARLEVVAAENTWGSIAAQLGGDRARVRSLITNPHTDPHDYEPTPADGRAVAGARYVIVNGVGYDAWASKMVDANPRPGRRVLDVGALVGVKAGANPHRWYSPPDVHAVVERITSDYKRLDAADAAYFDRKKTAFDTALAGYTSLIADIRSRYARTPVGASESIFSPLAEALDLDLRTPAAFLAAISEGSEPTAADKTTVDAQIRTRQIKVYVFNSQNATPDVRAQVDAARAAGIPVVAVTETLTPANASFQSWQVTQLRALQAALATGTRR